MSERSPSTDDLFASFLDGFSEETQNLLSQFIRSSTHEPDLPIPSRPPRRASNASAQRQRRKVSPLQSARSSQQKLPPKVKSNTAERSPKSHSNHLNDFPPASVTSSSTKENQSSRPSSSGMDRQVLPSRSKPARRSGRSRTEPTSYYKTPLLYQSEYDEADEADSDASARSTRIAVFRSEELQDPKYTLPRRGCRPTQPQRRPRNRPAGSHPDWQSILRSRELGRSVNRRLHSRIIPDLKPHKSWKGASNDVIVSTWSPDGSRFAAGATTQCDEHNMEYNRGNNLILGDLATNSLKELPDHWVPRPAGRSNQNVVDSRLYMTVTALQWFEDLLFSASYDNTVKLWDATNHANAHCVKSLHHSSKVQVMARSTFNQNILATGSKSIGLWNIDDASYSPLDITRPYKKDVEMTPTSLVWGGMPATNKILLAGLAEKESHDYDLPHSGLLAMWIMHEASMLPVQPTPNSQNVFDIKWHPSLAVFATANPLGPYKNPAAKDARSVVRTYEPLVMKSRSMEFDCPALDINDITFCPSDPNYITASCTDGITYVWDRRRPDQIVHRLEHDPPLNQMDENLTREQADVGVRLALWGGSMDQFYTGASDGVLRRWNILQAPEDALVDNVMSFPEEIMCGTFSEDKSNLLVGDCAGGVHVLSSSPFPYEPEDRQMRFERAAESDVDNSDSDSGIAAGDQLVSSGQLVRHPVYGVGQGPYYKGPFAAWARPKDTPPDQLARTPLHDMVQAQQLDGAPVKDRLGLDDKLREDVRGQIQLARIRNWRNENKRKRRQAASYINLVSDEEDDTPKSTTLKTKKRGKKVKSKGPIITRLESGVIDLTADTGYDELEDDLADDFWWPDSGDIDPNIGEDMS